MSNNKQEALDLIKQTIESQYPIRWVDDQTCMADFDGREVSIDVFNIEPKVYREFLKSVRGIRQKLEALVGSKCLFIFHTPEATKTYYSHIIQGNP